MVNKYFIPLLMLLGSFCVADSVFADGLRITVERRTVELGQPIWISIRSDQTRVSLNTIDLSPWQDKVVLPDRYYANTSEDQRGQVMKLKVYPYHAGELRLPGLYFLSRINKGVNINVIPARDRKTHSPINFQCHNSTSRPWQQQQVIIVCHIRMRNKYAVFKQPGMTKRNDVQVSDIQVQAQDLKQQRESMTDYALGWVVTPMNAGKLSLQLPPIQYVQDGVITREFYLPTQHFEVRQNPPWLPGTIPVGRVDVHQYAMSGLFLNTDVLSHIRLDMQFDGMPAAAIPDYALQLHSDKALRYYTTEKKQKTYVDVDGLHQRVIEDIPVVATQLGIHRLPDLRLQYFDPSIGALKTVLVAGSTIVVLNGWITAIVILCFSVLLFWLIRQVWRYLLRRWRRLRTYQQAARQLEQAKLLSDVKQAMQTMALAEGWSGNLTFMQWQARMQLLTPLASKLDVTSLNAASYDRAEIPLKSIVDCLTRIIRYRRWRTATSRQ